MYIKCNVFKKNGKWYTEEDVFVRDGIQDFDIPGQVYDNRQMEDKIYIGEGLQYKVPFLVPAI